MSNGSNVECWIRSPYFRKAAIQVIEDNCNAAQINRNGKGDSREWTTARKWHCTKLLPNALETLHIWNYLDHYDINKTGVVCCGIAESLEGFKWPYHRQRLVTWCATWWYVCKTLKNAKQTKMIQACHQGPAMSPCQGIELSFVCGGPGLGCITTLRGISRLGGAWRLFLRGGTWPWRKGSQVLGCTPSHE